MSLLTDTSGSSLAGTRRRIYTSNGALTNWSRNCKSTARASKLGELYWRARELS